MAFLTVLSLGSLEPGVLKQFLDTGEIAGMKVGSEVLLMLAVLILIPMIMAFLSVTLKDSANRWTNIIVGIFYTAFQLVDLGEISTVGTVYAYAVLLELSKVIAPALIVWIAWKSKQKA
jgi:hypothetical protein